MQIILDDGTVVQPAFNIGEVVGYRISPETPDQIRGVTIRQDGITYETAGNETQVYEFELLSAEQARRIGFQPGEQEADNET